MSADESENWNACYLSSNKNESIVCRRMEMI